MNDIEVSSIDLVEGGNVFKQGHYLTLGYVPRDEKGETVDLSGKTLNVSLWGRKGVVFEAAATYSGGVIRFTLDKMVPAGDYTVEFTVTSSTDAKYRKKFPTNKHSGRIAIKQSADDLGVLGIQVYTVAQLKAEQKAIQTQYESTVDAKVQASDAKSTTALTKSVNAEAAAQDVKNQFEQVVISGDSSVEAAAARVAPDQTFVSLKARLDAKEQATAAQLAETVKVINVKTMGAKGDGVTNDYNAIQSAINLAASTRANVFLPSGTYFVGQTLKTPHQTTYNYTNGIRIYGEGKSSVIKGADLRLPADYSAVSGMADQALLAIYGANNIIENISFEGGKVGLYLGQDPTKTAASSASMNIIRNLWFYYNGTGIVMIHGSGNHYNKFSHLHLAHAQIGIHLGKGFFLDQFNNNRNTFDNIRVSRMWIGFLVEQADGNFFTNIYGETISSGQTVGNRPAQLPQELGDKHCVFVAADGQYNTLDGFAAEACDWDIYSVGFRNSFVNLMTKDDTTANLKVMFPNPSRQPIAYRSNSMMMGDMIYQPQAGIFFDGSSGTGFRSGRVFDAGYHRQTVDLVPLCDQMSAKQSAARSRLNKLGNIIYWMTSYRFTASTAAKNDPIKIKIPLGLKLDFPYRTELAAGITMPVEAFVGITGPTEKVVGRWSSDAESTALGGDHIIIPAPTIGWNIGANTNYVFFDVSVGSVV